MTEQAQLPEPLGSKDGTGAADNDQPYTFGRKLTSNAPFPFTYRQYTRLIILKSKLWEQPGNRMVLMLEKNSKQQA